MKRTKELYEESQPVSLEQQIEFKEFNTLYHLTDDDDMTDYYREREQELFDESFNNYFDSRYEY